jgi:hypothetical protein
VKMSRFAVIAVPAAAVVALPFAAPAFAASGATGHPATTHKQASNVAVYDCANQPQVRPSEFDIFCDGSGAIIHLSWSGWNTSMATATGVEYVDNCVPNCAAGKFSHQNVDLIFWDSKPVKGHAGKYGYTKMTTLFPSSGKTYTQTPPGEFPGEF